MEHIVGLKVKTVEGGAHRGLINLLYIRENRQQRSYSCKDKNHGFMDAVLEIGNI